MMKADEESTTIKRSVKNALGKVMFALLTALSAFARPQNPPPLQISSPADGFTVNPGQTLTVTVTSPAGLAFQMVAVIGPDPIGLNTLASSVPAQFSIAIPSDADCRLYTLTADGLTQSGQHVTSASIQIDVERPDFPVSLSASDVGLRLESQGEQVHLAVLADFSDGSTVDVTHSTLLSYASSNAAVATVDASGTVTAATTGSASITVKYTLSGQSMQIVIPLNVSSPRLAVSPTSLTFAAQAVGTSSAAQQLTLTNATQDNLTILGLTVSGDFSETDNCTASSPLGPNSSCIASVTFSPTVSGSRTGQLNVANSGNTVPVSIPLSGSGTTAPAITGLSPNSGPVGTSVTITGVNFGASQGTSGVTFNGTTATPTSWSATSIVTPVPTGATTGNVVVTVGGVASNAVTFTVTTTASPSITSLNPTSGPVGTSVTISGTNFGSTQGTSTVKFNGTAATPTSWSATSIVAPVPSGSTTGNVVVTVGGAASNGVTFTVTTTASPSITSLNPTSGPVGTSVTISGTNFGSTQGTSTVTFNGTAATPTSWSATSIVAPVVGTSVTIVVVVTVGGVPSNGVTFTLCCDEY